MTRRTIDDSRIRNELYKLDNPSVHCHRPKSIADCSAHTEEQRPTRQEATQLGDSSIYQESARLAIESDDTTQQASAPSHTNRGGVNVNSTFPIATFSTFPIATAPRIFSTFSVTSPASTTSTASTTFIYARNGVILTTSILTSTTTPAGPAPRSYARPRTSLLTIWIPVRPNIHAAWIPKQRRAWCTPVMSIRFGLKVLTGKVPSPNMPTGHHSLQRI